MRLIRLLARALAIVEGQRVLLSPHHSCERAGSQAEFARRLKARLG